LRPNFFIPIDRSDLGDGPLRGVNFVRYTCAEKQGFYMLSPMLQIVMNALFRVQNCSRRVSMKIMLETVSLYYYDLNFYTHGKSML